ncbi:MAG: GNAT family N-acetyltransferase [Anaerolineales bacterium]|nr:MAG: GNAT family N-acetyltransferase [Anaerolineales bacterium]
MFTNIRKATPQDAKILSDLCRDVQTIHAEHHADIFKLPQSADFAATFFEKMLADETVHIFIAENNGEALGYILCKLIEREETVFTFAMRYLLVDQISVGPEARGGGVGSVLMAHADDLADELGVSMIQLDSWAFNTGAHKFFEREGFQKFNHRFWRRK